MDFEPLRAYLNRLTDWIIPGNAISVWKDGKEVFVGQSGYADVETKEPMTADHWINIYSTSKVTTVTAAAQLLEQGYFLLEDPVWAYLPAYRDLQVRWPDGSVRKAEKTMTMRHLFTMTSGLDYNCGGPAIEKARALTGGAMDTVTVANCLAGEPLSFEPGTHWQYSLSHDVLAAVVEVISGKRFRDYVRENLFELLGIEKAVYHNEPVRDRMAQQYNYAVEAETDPVELQRSSRNEHGRLENVGKGVVNFVFGPEYDSGGAGITTTVREYARLAAALAGNGLGANGERILAPGTVELLRTNQLDEVQMRDFNWAALKGYGYGLGVRCLLSKAAAGTVGGYGELGWGGAAGAAFYADPTENLGVFYAHHMLNPQEDYYQPRLRNVIYNCIRR